MACVKLTFIKYKGRAEFIRFLLAQASVNYEDVRLEVEEWAEKMKGIGNCNSEETEMNKRYHCPNIWL